VVDWVGSGGVCFRAFVVGNMGVGGGERLLCRVRYLVGSRLCPVVVVLAFCVGLGGCGTTAAIGVSLGCCVVYSTVLGAGCCCGCVAVVM